MSRRRERKMEEKDIDRCGTAFNCRALWVIYDCLFATAEQLYTTSPSFLTPLHFFVSFYVHHLKKWRERRRHGGEINEERGEDGKRKMMKWIRIRKKERWVR